MSSLTLEFRVKHLKAENNFVIFESFKYLMFSVVMYFNAKKTNLKKHIFKNLTFSFLCTEIIQPYILLKSYCT